MRKRNQRKYFSLIELLIVVAILAILVGMLLPALRSARGKACDIQCLGNQKQIALLLNSYIDASDGVTPWLHGNPVEGATDKNKWIGPLVLMQYPKLTNSSYPYLLAVNGWRHVSRTRHFRLSGELSGDSGGTLGLRIRSKRAVLQQLGLLGAPLLQGAGSQDPYAVKTGRLF